MTSMKISMMTMTGGIDKIKTMTKYIGMTTKTHILKMKTTMISIMNNKISRMKIK